VAGPSSWSRTGAERRCFLKFEALGAERVELRRFAARVLDAL
jgi:hypothetical protein